MHSCKLFAISMALSFALGCGNAEVVEQGRLRCTSTDSYYSCARVTIEGRSFDCIAYKSGYAGGLSCHPLEGSP